MFDSSTLGRLAMARRIVSLIDTALALCPNDQEFGPAEYQEMQEMIQSLMRARRATSNIMIRLGDESAFTTQPSITLHLVYPEEYDTKT